MRVSGRRRSQKRVLAAERHRPRGTLDAVAVEFDAPIVEEPKQSLLVAQRVADRLRHGAARRQPWQHRLEPDEQLLGQRTAPRLAFGQTPLRRGAADLGLDRVECIDAAQRLFGERRLGRPRQVVELPSRMAPAERHHRRTRPRGRTGSSRGLALRSFAASPRSARRQRYNRLAQMPCRRDTEATVTPRPQRLTARRALPAAFHQPRLVLGRIPSPTTARDDFHTLQPSTRSHSASTSAGTNASISASHTARPDPNPSAIPSHETTRHRSTSTTAAVPNSTRQRKKGHKATLTRMPTAAQVYTDAYPAGGRTAGA
jgi:hypothetical protein